MRLLIIICGFILDMLFGDPLGVIHPVRGIGLIISAYEKVMYRKGGRHLKAKGVGLVIFVIFITTGITLGLVMLSFKAGFIFGVIVEVLISWSVLSAHGLKRESMKVYRALKDNDDLSFARQSLSMIVGRDTASLNEEEISKAAVETVAENSSDGEIAPLFYLIVGGPVLATMYKAINTMDSMVGYRNERYEDYGWAAAKLDDAANFIPARIAGLMSVAAAFITGYDGPNAYRIFKRDRNSHESPNAGQTESAYAGALGLSLGGDASYFGEVRSKPVMGTATRPCEGEDIARANVLMYAASWLSLIIMGGVYAAYLLW